MEKEESVGVWGIGQSESDMVALCFSSGDREGERERIIKRAKRRHNALRILNADGTPPSVRDVLRSILSDTDS